MRFIYVDCVIPLVQNLRAFQTIFNCTGEVFKIFKMRPYNHKIIKQYYELAPRPPNEVGTIWKSIHILLLALSAICGYISAYTFGVILKTFDYHCILYSKMIINVHNASSESDHKYDNLAMKSFIDEMEHINVLHGSWTSDSVCYFVQFTEVSSMITSIVWIVFFFIYGRNTGVNSHEIVGRPWRMIVPFLLWTILTILVLFSCNQVYGEGFRQICWIRGPSDDNHCLGIKHASFISLFGYFDGTDIYRYFFLSKIFGYLGLTAWAANLIWTVLRIYLVVDFQILFINFIQYSKKSTSDEDQAQKTFLKASSTDEISANPHKNESLTMIFSESTENRSN